jgi:hypothetical protein
MHVCVHFKPQPFVNYHPHVGVSLFGVKKHGAMMMCIQILAQDANLHIPWAFNISLESVIILVHDAS